MRPFQLALPFAVAMLVAGCEETRRVGEPSPQPAPPVATPSKKPSPEQIAEAFTALNDAFAKAYEGVLTQRGTRNFRVQPAVAYDALQAALTRLGMIVESRDPFTGTLTVAAPAPKPLSLKEWQEVVQADLPLMASILCPRLGAFCKQLSFAPDDYVIVINATVLRAADSGSTVSLTTRMREIVPRPGTPRRDYPPPTGVRMALDKIWTGLVRQLAADQAPAGRSTR